MAKFGAIIATMENLEQQQALANAEEGVEAQETATEVAETAAGAENEAAEVAQTDTAIDDAEAAQDQIGELTEVAQDSLVGEGETVEEGEVGQEGEGLSEGEATMVEITHETIMKNLGIEYSRRTYTPESFGTKKSRRQVTLEAIATLEETKQGLGAKIVSALRAAFDMVVGFIAKILANRTLMEKHLNNLEARLKNLNEGQKKEQTLNAGASQLSVNGKADTSTAMEVLNAATGNLVMAKTAAEMLYKAKDGGNGFDLGMQLDKAIKDLPTNGEGKGILGGGKAFKITIPEGDVTIKQASEAKIEVSVIDATPVGESIAAPSKSDMQNILTAAKRVLTALKEAEGIRSRLKGFVEAVKLGLAKAYATVASKVGTEKSKEQASNANVYINVARTGRAFMGKIMTTVFSSSFKSVKAAADYVSAGIKNMGGEAGGAAPAGEATAA